MFDRLIASKSGAADRPAVPSGTVSVLVHAGVCAAAVLATLDPHRLAGPRAVRSQVAVARSPRSGWRPRRGRGPGGSVEPRSVGPSRAPWRSRARTPASRVRRVHTCWAPCSGRGARTGGRSGCSCACRSASRSGRLADRGAPSPGCHHFVMGAPLAGGGQSAVFHKGLPDRALEGQNPCLTISSSPGARRTASGCSA